MSILFGRDILTQDLELENVRIKPGLSGFSHIQFVW